MRLRRFYAATMPVAMAEVKAALGDEAVIVSSRREKGQFCVTAALDESGSAAPAETTVSSATSEKSVDHENWLDALHAEEELVQKQKSSPISSMDEAAETTEHHEALHDSMTAELGQDTQTHVSGDPIYPAPQEDMAAGDFLDPDNRPLLSPRWREGIKLDTCLDRLVTLLAYHRLPAPLMERILHAVETEAENGSLRAQASVQEALTQALETTIRFDPWKPQPVVRPVALVGQPGVGKTLAIAKMAAQAVLEDLSVMAITTDTVRAGGIEQLQAFTSVLDVPLADVATLEEMRTQLQSFRDADQILIDTAGADPFDVHAVRSLYRLTRLTPMEVILVLPAGHDIDETIEVAKAFAMLGISRILPTRVDIARRMGGILGAALKTGMSLCGMAMGANAAGGITSLTADDLAYYIIHCYDKRMSSGGASLGEAAETPSSARQSQGGRA